MPVVTELHLDRKARVLHVSFDEARPMHYRLNICGSKVRAPRFRVMVRGKGRPWLENARLVSAG